MSVVVARNCARAQFWCADRRLVQEHGDQWEVVSHDHRKVMALPGRPVILGFSGTAYDAQVMMETISATNLGGASLDDFHGLVREIVVHVNWIAASFARQRRLKIYETGLVVGGFWNERRFLTVAPPDGHLRHMRTFAAIGYDAVGIDEAIAEATAADLACEKVRALIDGWFTTRCAGDALACNRLDRYLVIPTGVYAIDGSEDPLRKYL